ncbi:hypothetical protein ACFYOK_29290 [Microbispora bryophytorum]|uniref:hypothetical protein n=1 Tax=Microbispora bryophytorum TaxID=1460882 RepID=UPI0033EAC429
MNDRMFAVMCPQGCGLAIRVTDAGMAPHNCPKAVDDETGGESPGERGRNLGETILIEVHRDSP